jgi:hypothetical protein
MPIDAVTPPVTDPNAPPAGGTPPSPRWFEADTYAPEEREWLTARGLAVDDPLAVIPKLVKGHRGAEQKLGKGLDSIMDRPGKDQPLPDWLRANAAVLGLPDSEDGYKVDPPEGWPKDMPWDGELEAAARKLAFDAGVPKSAHDAYVGLFATKMQALEQAATEGLAKAREAMMGELTRDWGDAVPAKIAQAQQAASAFGVQAGLSAEQIAGITQVLAEKTGDAGVLKLFAAIGAAMGEDRGLGLGAGGGLTMTPAEAKEELRRFESPEGDYGKAFAAGDYRRLAELKARREQLSRIAAAG